MDKTALKSLIQSEQERGRKVAISFCSHVPQEVIMAAGFTSIRVFHVDGVEDISSRILPKNICPVVAQCTSLCEDGTFSEADLIIAESSCDGKKKMYELLTMQDKLYYYQVPQGEDRSYVKPLIESECRYLIKMFRDRFGVEVDADKIRESGDILNAERQSIMELMQIQRETPPKAWGLEIYRAMEESRSLPDRIEATELNREFRQSFQGRESKVPKSAKRILVTGCPLGGVYEKVISAIENHGGVVVCFENCEVVKSARRSMDTKAPDVIEALADCYQNTACAIMAPNNLRFRLIEELVGEYQAEGVLDLTLQTCHSYSVERDKMSRLCETMGIPYIAVEVDASDADAGQLNTRIAAFIEML